MGCVIGQVQKYKYFHTNMSSICYVIEYPQHHITDIQLINSMQNNNVIILSISIKN